MSGTYVTADRLVELRSAIERTFPEIKFDGLIKGYLDPSENELVILVKVEDNETT